MCIRDSNHGDTSPGSNGTDADYYLPGNGTGIINSSLAVFDADGLLTRKWKEKTTLTEIFDGTSNTILAGELHIPRSELNQIPFNGPLYNGLELVAHTRVGGPGAPLLGPNDDGGALLGFGSAHAVTNFVYVDGSTRSLAFTTDTIVLGRLCHRADGEIIETN